MAIIGATIKDKAVAKFTKILKSPELSYFQIIKKEPTIKIIILKLYNLLLLIKEGDNNSKVLLSALTYPSNTAIQVPNIIEKVLDAIII